MKIAGMNPSIFSNEKRRGVRRTRLLERDALWTQVSTARSVLQHLLKKNAGLGPAFFIYRFSRVGLRCDFSAGVAGAASRPLETRLLLEFHSRDALLQPRVAAQVAA